MSPETGTGGLPPDTKDEMTSLADAMGISVHEVEEAILSLMQQGGYPAWGAISVYKSKNRNKISGKKGKYYFIPLHKSDLKKIPPRDAKAPQAEVVDVLGLCNVSGGEEFVLTQLSLWSTPSDASRPNRTQLAFGLKEDKVYNFDGSYNPATKKMSMVGTSFEEIVDADVDVFSVVKSIQPVPIASVEDYLGKPSFFSGFVGKVWNADDDSSSLLEISDALATPVTCWFNNTRFTEQDWLGKKVAVLGIASKPEEKEARINGRRYWLV